ncbi:hypothetical protein SAMN05660776_2929 [Salegentibacter holothuriorum]|uniref:Membrane dipeptidase (Peptidase family M19) n=1 Tax=Salegentibacter holothuriorum TaxID=241145 RepID=A0A1T5E0V4_9FLAO|nr:hypothetical protein [Salegentibacter holothuriorum]SKB77390.1 hypothetical protein SAMN05660776_2929 [Salegentibacter holothuriorum]
MESNFIVDLHCHPSMKPFARSFAKTPGLQSRNPRHKHSIWFHDAPSLFDKIKNYIATLTNFVQSDGTSLKRGRVAVVCLSFYPQEKQFFKNKLGKELISDVLTMLATEFGKERIDHIQDLKSYWEDLKLEMKFLKQESGNKINIDGQKVCYLISNSYADIEIAERNNELGESKIIFIPTIEGGHVFDQVMNPGESWNTYPDGVSKKELKRLVKRVKELRREENGLIRPVFITLAHHFWNGLCGHSQSLGGLVKCIVDQDNGMNKGLTEAGKRAIRAMLEKETDKNGHFVPPIYVDIKHMSRKSRLDFFDFLKEFDDQNIPIIVSHGGVTGLSEPGGTNQTPAAQQGLFMTDDINFYDDELIKIGNSNGLFGIQLDERRIGSKVVLREARGNIKRRDILYSWSKLVWNQIRHIAETLDLNNQFAWGIQALGTDFDGIIDPINGYWTSQELNKLDDYLLMHTYNYLKEVKEPCPLKQPRNKAISAEQIVERVTTSNALNVLSRIM